jgi:CRISPR-associated protein Cas5d
MSFGVRLHVSGLRACFTRPEMKVERVSYDVMTPSAARGILEAIHWKPAITWTIDRIHVLKPIRFQSFRRNEVGTKISFDKARRAMRSGDIAGLGLVVEDNRQQRATTLLVNVAYVVEAHFEMTDKAEPHDTPAKHITSSRPTFGCLARTTRCPEACFPKINATEISAGCSTISTLPTIAARASSARV